MPLELVNFSKSTLKIFPFLPICQVMFVRLSSLAEAPYGTRELSSKYMDDDGGPSYWWRDKRIKELQTALGERDVSELMQNELLRLFSPRDPDLVERFENFVRRLRNEEMTNARDLLERFARSEDWKRTLARLKRGAMIGIFPILLSASLGSLFSQPFGWNHYGWLHYSLWVTTVMSLPLGVAGLRCEVGEYFGLKELEGGPGNQKDVAVYTRHE
jgi:hypothetical protein